MKRAKPRPNLSATSAFDHVDWDLAIAHYDAERLEQAYETALDVGMGRVGQYLNFFRTIEAEHLTRERSSSKGVQPFLEIEWVPEELDGKEDFVATVAQQAFFDVGSRFGYTHESKVRLTVLAEETNAPWLYGRFGYCVWKVPYYKICIPLNLVDRRQELYNTLRHEYAHVVVGTLSKNRAPRWIEEAVAMLAEGGVSPGNARLFSSGQEEWIDPAELEADIRELTNGRDRWLGYVQAGLVGMYVAETFGESAVGELLRGFLAGSGWQELMLRLRGKGPEEGAFRRILGVSAERLFRDAELWVLAGMPRGAART